MTAAEQPLTAAVADPASAAGAAGPLSTAAFGGSFSKVRTVPTTDSDGTGAVPGRGAASSDSDGAGAVPGAGAASSLSVSAAAGPPATASTPRPEDGAGAPAAVAATVIDAGVGNLGNLVRALAHVGAVPEVTREPRRIAAARCLLLPGVGAFAPPREALRGAMEEALGEALAAGAWLLGICVGFQLLFEAGEEFGVTDGLGLLPGRVTRLPAGVPVPHIGWNRLHGLASHPLLAGLERPASAAAAAGRVGRHVYFVHSYAPEGVPADCCLALATHGRAFPAVAARGRVIGTQFHPERSGAAGLRLLANFLRLAAGAAAAAGTAAAAGGRR